MVRQVGSWQLHDLLGQGSFAVVWKATHVQSGQLAAVKEVATSKLNRKLRDSLASEVSILEKTSHKNLVGLLDIIREEGRLFLVLEFCGGGDLGHYLRRFGRVPEATAHHLLFQLAEGLCALRAQNLVHRDLKPQNLLLSDTSTEPQLKIADFGFARQLQPQGLAETLCGSPLYMAPEILQFHKYDAKADLWSVGAILFELLSGRPPYTGINHLQLLQNIERGEGGRLPDSVAAALSTSCKQLLHGLLRRNPMERMGYEEFFAHPFLSAALIPLSIAPATPYPAASAPTRAHVSEKGGVGGAAVGWAGAGGGITLCPIVSLPSRSPSPRAWAVGAGVGGGVAGLVASSPSSDSIQRSGSPGQGTGGYSDVDLGTPTPSPPPLAPLPDMGPPLGGMLSVIEEGDDYVVVSSGPSPHGSACGSPTGGGQQAMGASQGLQAAFMRSSSAAGRGRRAWDALAQAMVSGPSLLPLQLQLPPRLVASATSQLRGAVAAGVAAATFTPPTPSSTPASASAGSRPPPPTPQPQGTPRSSHFFPDPDPTAASTPPLPSRPLLVPLASTPAQAGRGSSGGQAPTPSTPNLSGTGSAPTPPPPSTSAGTPPSARSSVGANQPGRLAPATVAQLVKLPEQPDRGDLLLRVLLIVAEHATARWDAAVAVAEVAGEAAALAAAPPPTPGHAPLYSHSPQQAEFSSGTSATLVVSSRQQGDGGSQNGQGLGMSSGQGQALGASSGQGLGASSGQGIGSGQGMGSGPGNSRHGQFGAGSGSSSSTAAVPTPSGHAQTTGHTHASQQQQAQEWQMAPGQLAGMHAAATAAAAAATLSLRPASAELLSFHLLACHLLRQALALGPQGALPAHQAALLQGHARTVLGPLHERAQVAARHAAPGETLPWPTQVLVHAAMGLARGAALDELLGLPGASVQGYAKAADLILYLLLGGLNPQPQGRRSPEAGGAKQWQNSGCQARHMLLHKTYAAVRVRQQAAIRAMQPQQSQQ